MKMSEVIMENGNGNEATNKDIVVVGNIHALSQTRCGLSMIQVQHNR